MNNTSYQSFKKIMAIIILLMMMSIFPILLLSNKNNFQNLLEVQQSYWNTKFQEWLLEKDWQDITLPLSLKNGLSTYVYNTPLIPVHSTIVKGTSKDVQGSDTIIIQYAGDASGSIANCYGTPLANKQVTQSYLFIKDNNLACTQVIDGKTDLSKINILIENVEAMRIRYGEDADNDGQVRRYISADNLNMTKGRIVEIKMWLLLRTFEPVNTLLDSTYYRLDDTELGPYNDHYLRKTISYRFPITK